MIHNAPLREALLRFFTRRWPRSMLIVAGAALVPLLLLSTRRAPAPAAVTRDESAGSLPFTLAGGGGRLSLVWDREAPAIRAGECGVLWISDGGIHRRVILDTTQLRAGKLFYWPVNKDVSFEIKMSGKGRIGETVCGNNATSLRQPAEVTASQEPRAERGALPNRLSTIRMAPRQSVESPQSEDGHNYEDTRIEAGNAPTNIMAGESQFVETSPVHAILFPPVGEEQILSTAARPVLQEVSEPYSTVAVQAVMESRLSRIAGKVPPLRWLRARREFLPPKPIRETTPAVPAELRRTLKSEVKLDVRTYIDQSGKVTYAEMLSNINEADRDLASLAVFDARHWEFTPARLGERIVPGQAILHYRFGNPLMATSGAAPSP